MINIEVNMDSVVIEGTVVPRPVTISRARWMAFWERVKRLKVE